MIHLPKQNSKLYYDAFLVRIWVDDVSNWRATIEHVSNGKRQTFTSVEDFLAFIQSQIVTSTKETK